MKIVVSILMFVGRFSVKVSRDFTVNERHADVKKWYGCERIVRRCKFDGGVNVVEVRSEVWRSPTECVHITKMSSMLPHHV